MTTAQMVTLAPEQKQFFDDNGYLVMEGLYDAAEMAVMRREFHDLIAIRMDVRDLALQLHGAGGGVSRRPL